MKAKRVYNPPITEMVEVEFEGGFMSASVMDPNDNRDDGVSIKGHEVGNTGPNDNRDDGVSIKGHEVGNTGDYTDIGWDGDNTFNN